MFPFIFLFLWSIGNEIDYPCAPYVTPLFREALGNNDANKRQPFGDLELLGMENGIPDDLTPYSEAGIHLWTAEGLRTDLSVRISA